MTFASEHELDTLQAAFLSGTLPKSDWTHAAHVAVAATFVWADPEGALDKMRNGICSLNECHGTANTETSGYHETLTVFWVAVVRNYCSSRRAEPRKDVINQMLVDLPRDIFKRYYAFDVVGSTEARKEWVAPDLLPLAV